MIKNLLNIAISGLVFFSACSYATTVLVFNTLKEKTNVTVCFGASNCYESDFATIAPNDAKMLNSFHPYYIVDTVKASVSSGNCVPWTGWGDDQSKFKVEYYDGGMHCVVHKY